MGLPIEITDSMRGAGIEEMICTLGTENLHADEVYLLKRAQEVLDSKFSNYVQVHASGEYFADWQPDFFDKYFIECFPFGRGGIGEERRRHMTHEECIAKYRKSSQKAFQSPAFVLISQNVMSRMQAAKKSYLTCKTKFSGESLGSAFATLTKPQLALMAKYIEAKIKYALPLLVYVPNLPS